MRRDFVNERVVVAVCLPIFAAMLATCDARAQNGPMSSTKPPEAAPANAQAAAANQPSFDVEKLFANVCGWCHSNGGRTAGKGPQLMGTSLTDAEIVNRIKQGKLGAMPAFAGQFTDDQIAAIVRYIRNLKDDAK
jgi:mono/diheme cytochrome c family protein